jgi:hypothetical protein
MKNELQDPNIVDPEDYVRSSYLPVSLARAVRRQPGDARVTAVADRGVRKDATMCGVVDFGRMFSLPREPLTVLTPGQSFELAVPKGQRVVVTDVYIENLDDGVARLLLMEQEGSESFEVRYSFAAVGHQVTSIRFTTGLRLGDEDPIAGTIRIENDTSSQANILPRINGFFVG